MSSNPFTVSSPEMMDAGEMRRLYVPLAEDFEIEDIGHVFVHGHRGCGKSMMLRLMAPDCKCLELQVETQELPYLGLYASIKSTDLDIAEFDRIKNQYAGAILAEHSLCLFLASKVIQSLLEHTGGLFDGNECQVEIEGFVNKYIATKLDHSVDSSGKNPLNFALEVLDAAYSKFMDYMRQLSLREEYVPYEGRVVGYRDFLFPLCSNLNEITLLPSSKPVYILLDDADNLNSIQTQVLNTWVSYRTGPKVSFKVSTQLGYKHYRTLTNQRIESPHDFKEVNISTIYTGGIAKGSYPEWVEQIVTKRLQENGIEKSARLFFQPPEEQEAAIEAIKIKLRENWDANGRGYRPSDDATRYARPDYIKSLGGQSKQGRTYLYAGFDQLVHISSGIVRYFLDDAASMYAEEKKLRQAKGASEAEVVDFIRPSIQDQVVRSSADALMIDNLDKLQSEAEQAMDSVGSKDEFKQLRNLIQALGGIFQAILMSDRSERRVFSIALSDSPPDEIMKILKLGVSHGFLYEAAIGSKDGKSRTRRYVLTRRLAPMFKLDPTGFSGYLFVTTDLLHSAISNPARAVRDFESGRLGGATDAQLALELT